MNRDTIPDVYKRQVKGSGSDEVLRTESRPGNHIEGKAERLIGVHVEPVSYTHLDVYKRQARNTEGMSHSNERCHRAEFSGFQGNRRYE